LTSGNYFSEKIAIGITVFIIHMRSILLSAFVFASVSMFSQITATVITPDEAVALLCGPNVVYSNITFTGGPEQLGS
jgi:hypothetical protein